MGNLLSPSQFFLVQDLGPLPLHILGQNHKRINFQNGKSEKKNLSVKEKEKPQIHENIFKGEVVVNVVNWQT